MNVFEDLIVELKEENLLEETIIERPLEASALLHGAQAQSNGNGSADHNGNGKPSVEFRIETPHKEKYRAAPKSEVISAKLADQVAALQLIEFVIAASDRANGGHSIGFDELTVKKALHHYGQTAGDPDSDEFFEAESTLISSINAWEADLTDRDSRIPPTALRKYAENANPPLSPQALFAVLRFYRGVPVSESSYAKFDFIVTRLFSKFVDGERRDLLCPRGEIVRHLTQRYAEWGMEGFKSIPADDPDVALLGLSFDDFRAEAEASASFRELVSSKFFERFLELKRSAGALYFVPLVTAAAIEANLRISTKVSDLVSAEKERNGMARLSGVDRVLVSDAIARTFDPGTPSDIADNTDTDQPPVAAHPKTRTPKPIREKKTKRMGQGSSSAKNLFGINKWLLIVTVLAVIASLGIYVWAEYYANEPQTASNVKTLPIGDPEIKPFIRTAKVSGTILYAVVTPGFEQLSQEQQTDLAKKLQQQGVQNGYERVAILNGEGKTIIYASASRVEVKGK
jgi:hypothetical protein